MYHIWLNMCHTLPFDSRKVHHAAGRKVEERKVLIFIDTNNECMTMSQRLVEICRQV